MTKIATLGPAGTYSDMATKRYIKKTSKDFDIQYFSSIKSALSAIGTEIPYGVLPIENFSEGFLSLVLDHLIQADLSIIGEMMLPIQFSLASKAGTTTDIERLYVQFVAKGQCTEFITSLPNAKVMTTESNMQSLHLAIEDQGAAAAVVPSISFDPEQFPLVIQNINDYKNNQTRFLVFSSRGHLPKKSLQENFKTSIIVTDDHDHPGFLGGVLSSFAQRSINLTSIISRPSRQIFGKYHFFIDFDGHLDDVEVIEALEEIRQKSKVKPLGAYKKAAILS